MEMSFCFACGGKTAAATGAAADEEAASASGRGAMFLADLRKAGAPPSLSPAASASESGGAPNCTAILRCNFWKMDAAALAGATGDPGASGVDAKDIGADGVTGLVTTGVFCASGTSGAGVPPFAAAPFA
ncbi:MAG: hypothetical protein LBB52_04760 [Desulfovibrio sp.]|nr:hypothetical protein [Desulfovibrio sp.]